MSDLDGPRAAAQRMQEAARHLAHSTRSLERPSDSSPILGSLLDTQRSIEQTLRQLAEWHRSPAASAHYSDEHDESTLGLMTAVSELDLAAQQANGLQETLARAYGGNSVVRWFDTTDPDADL
jgi:TorA maturation chaperone TorD